MKMTDSVKNFFGFIKIPFSNTTGVNELYRSRNFKEACSHLELASETENIALLTGGIGTGKSSVLRYFSHNLDTHVYKAMYVAGSEKMKKGELAKQALFALQLEVPYTSSTAIRKLKKHIVKLNSEKGIKPVLILDEAQDLPLETLLGLKTLINYQMDSENYLFIILCGQKELVQKLELSPLEALEKRIRIRYQMKELTLDETSAYIEHELKTCGLDKKIFTDETKAQIYTHSKGEIRMIADLCFNLIIHAAAKSKDIIEPSMIPVILSNKN